MLTLGIDCSALSASAAVCEGERIVAYSGVNAGVTHSETLLPMVEAMLASAKLGFAEIGRFAVSAGPGSFTGLRIGISLVKGLAFALDKPAVPVSTLEGLAYNLTGFDAVACAVMDARRGQLYNALFRVRGGSVERLTEDRMIAAGELAEELAKLSEKIIIVGDGAEVLLRAGSVGELAPPLLRLQNAVSVCRAAEVLAENSPENIKTARQLMPGYLRLPQAERERLANL